ncbi:hypothetical protein ES332_D07G052200v1 [Gossypium tomentosum]|uniref:Uncharacterized protein n=1 Tax=Gossypium tomentosum TaxID=34277 RepID=A0A5D2K4J6_GOSTO|nr:hypothetical protein ES332_D07G052200v1 [Gossypium tomentosum]
MIIIMLLCNFCKPTPHFQLKIIVFFPTVSCHFFLSFSLLPNTIFLFQNTKFLNMFCRSLIFIFKIFILEHED